MPDSLTDDNTLDFNDIFKNNSNSDNTFDYNELFKVDPQPSVSKGTTPINLGDSGFNPGPELGSGLSNAVSSAIDTFKAGKEEYKNAPPSVRADARVRTLDKLLMHLPSTIMKTSTNIIPGGYDSDDIKAYQKDADRKLEYFAPNTRKVADATGFIGQGVYGSASALKNAGIAGLAAIQNSNFRGDTKEQRNKGALIDAGLSALLPGIFNVVKSKANSGKIKNIQDKRNTPQSLKDEGAKLGKNARLRFNEVEVDYESLIDVEQQIKGIPGKSGNKAIQGGAYESLLNNIKPLQDRALKTRQARDVIDAANQTNYTIGNTRYLLRDDVQLAQYEKFINPENIRMYSPTGKPEDNIKLFMNNADDIKLYDELMEYSNYPSAPIQGDLDNIVASITKYDDVEVDLKSNFTKLDDFVENQQKIIDNNKVTGLDLYNAQRYTKDVGKSHDIYDLISGKSAISKNLKAQYPEIIADLEKANDLYKRGSIGEKLQDIYIPNSKKRPDKGGINSAAERATTIGGEGEVITKYLNKIIDGDVKNYDLGKMLNNLDDGDYVKVINNIVSPGMNQKIMRTLGKLDITNTNSASFLTMTALVGAALFNTTLVAGAMGVTAGSRNLSNKYIVKQYSKLYDGVLGNKQASLAIEKLKNLDDKSLARLGKVLIGTQEFRDAATVDHVFFGGPSENQSRSDKTSEYLFGTRNK